jgi:rubrerythrin
MRINGISTGYPYRRVEKVSKIFSENKNRENSRRFGEAKRYTCAHCGVGIVDRLPARCPECNRLLSEPVERKTKK